MQSLLLVLVAAIPLGAAAQLNPTVKVLPAATSTAPPECDQALAPQEAQRLTPEERTIVRDTRADMQPPPSVDLRGQLKAAFDAAQNGRRDAFRDALTHAKSLLGSYPPGGERTAATNLVSAFDDLDQVWDYQFSSPTGSFFDASSEPFHIASRVPGYEAYVRRQVIVDQNGNKFYPTSETRDFLVNEAGARLSRLTGEKVPARTSVRGTTIPSSKPAISHGTTSSHHAEKPAAPQLAPKHATVKAVPHRSAAPRTHKPVTHEARTTPPAVAATHGTPKPAKTPVTSATPAAPFTTPMLPPIVQTTSPTANPVAPPPALTSPTVTSPADTMSSAASTDTAVSSALPETDTASTEAENAGKPAKSRSFFWPVILIIVGVGLLVTLWRASS